MDGKEKSSCAEREKKMISENKNEHLVHKF